MRENKSVLAFSEKKIPLRIYCEDIVFLESDGHYILVHTEDGHIYRMRCTMARLFEMIGTEAFKRTHRAFAVNLSFVQRVEGAMVYLHSNWKTVPLSRTYKETFSDAFMAYEG